MPLDLTNAVLTFRDEFDSFSWNSSGPSSIAPSRTPTGTWTTHYYWGAGDRSLPGNGELEYYADPSTAIVQSYPWTNPFSVSDGVLTITARPSPDASKSGGLPYVSGMITTDGTFKQTYGYFEMRADIPAGQGIWPAFWMLNSGHTWPPELDIMEVIGSEPWMLHTTAHTGIGGHSTTGMNKGTNVGDLSTGYHSYGASIMPDRITWYLDGNEVFSSTTPEDMKQDMYLIANLAVGGYWPGSPDGSTPWPAEMKIDYIRAYQLPGTPGYATAVPVGGTTSAPATPASLTVGSGSDSLVLRVSQDAWQGDAQYTVSVDGRQLGGTLTAKALHGSGQSDTVTVKGDWAAGTHSVVVNFLNDAYGGTASADRNLFVDGATYNGTAVTGAGISLYSAGGKGFSFTEAASTSPTPVGTTIGSGSDRIVIRLSEDAWQGDAQYTVSVDGVQQGGVMTAKALRGSGAVDTLTVQGDWNAGGHTVTVNFLNDAYGGTAASDRNLHVEGITWNDVAVGGTPSTLWSAGPRSFSATDATAAPGGDHTPASITLGSGADRLILKLSEDAYLGDAQYRIRVDGQSVGDLLTAKALRGAGQDTVTVQGDWAPGTHKVSVEFVNDLYGGVGKDRNLFVEGVLFDDAALPGGAIAMAGGTANLWSAGTQDFYFS